MPISRLSFGSNDDFNFPPLVCCSNNTLSKLLNVSLVSGTIVNGRLRGGKIWFLPRLGDCRFVAHGEFANSMKLFRLLPVLRGLRIHRYISQGELNEVRMFREPLFRY